MFIQRNSHPVQPVKRKKTSAARGKGLIERYVKGLIFVIFRAITNVGHSRPLDNKPLNAIPLKKNMIEGRTMEVSSHRLLDVRSFWPNVIILVQFVPCSFGRPSQTSRTPFSRRTRPSCTTSSLTNDERIDTAAPFSFKVKTWWTLRMEQVMMAKIKYKVVNLVKVSLAYCGPR